MSTITVILEPSADGTLHLPVPAEWRHQAIRVKAELKPVSAVLEAAPDFSNLKGFGCLKGKISLHFEERMKSVRLTVVGELPTTVIEP
jgi:hypothetical protein